MKRIVKIALLIIAILVVGFLVFQKVRELRREQTALDAQREILDTILEKDTVMETAQNAQIEQAPTDGGAIKQIERNVNFDVPFQPQAPFAVWDEIHEDTCEEASVVMVAFYRQGKSLSPQAMEDELQKLVAWQQEKFGYWKDTTAEETATIAREYYGLTPRVVYDLTIADIKKELSDGHLVLVPAAGRKLGNPFYKQPGPIYHMVVVRGYDSQFIYTNDPGTKRGENYKYYPEIILNAVADWPGSDEKMLAGETRRAMIVVE